MQKEKVTQLHITTYSICLMRQTGIYWLLEFGNK